MYALSTEDFLEELLSGSLYVLDVRSPAEFHRGSIPGAESLPLFDDAERSRVGIAYHQSGRTAAIKIGLEIVGPKLRSLIERAEHLLGGSRRRIGLYCWRGGMRSNAVGWLLELYGFDVVTLRGGYKAFRRTVLETFAQPRPLVLISGLTGAGKTDVLAALARRGQATIDFEQLAAHRGSAFGSLGMPPQPTQQQFENMLALELWKHRAASRLWLEDESRWIGKLIIPQALWLQMQSAPILALDVPMERRLERLLRDYGSVPPTQLATCLHAIRQRLGAERYALALAALNRGDLAEVATIALAHYDKSYRHSLRKRADRVVWIRANSPDDAATQLCTTIATLPSLTTLL